MIQESNREKLSYDERLKKLESEIEALEHGMEVVLISLKYMFDALEDSGFLIIGKETE